MTAETSSCDPASTWTPLPSDLHLRGKHVQRRRWCQALRTSWVALGLRVTSSASSPRRWWLARGSRPPRQGSRTRPDRRRIRHACRESSQALGIIDSRAVTADIVRRYLCLTEVLTYPKSASGLRSATKHRRIQGAHPACHCPLRSRFRGASSHIRDADVLDARLVCLGDDPDGRAIEVIAVEGSKEELIVIHAMALRKKYRDQWRQLSTRAIARRSRPRQGLASMCSQGAPLSQRGRAHSATRVRVPRGLIRSRSRNRPRLGESTATGQTRRQELTLGLLWLYEGDPCWSVAKDG
jgi:hypothetical protein